MTQQDFGTIDPATKSGTQLATDLNSWRDTLYSMHSGNSRPSYAATGILWRDTSGSVDLIKYYDGSDDIVLARVDATNNVITVPPRRQEVIKTADYTLVSDDAYVAIVMNKTGAGTLTLPPLSGTNFELYFVRNISNDTVTIDGDGGETIDGASSISLVKDAAVWIWPNDGKTAWRATIVQSPSNVAITGGSIAGTSSAAFRGMIYGLTLANNTTDATNDIDVATGAAADDSATPVVMALSSGLTKRLDASWAVGTGNGGLDTGSIANSWYYVWLIQRSDTGVVDALFSLSSTAPTMPTNYDRKRLIGPILRTGGGIKSFSQRREYFIWNSPVGDLVTSTPSLTAANVTLTVPPIDTVKARITALLINDPAADTGIWIREKSQADEALSQSSFDLFARDVSQISVAELERYVDGSGQIQYKSNDSGVTTFRIITKGFEFPR